MNDYITPLQAVTKWRDNGSLCTYSNHRISGLRMSLDSGRIVVIDREVLRFMFGEEFIHACELLTKEAEL